VQPTFDAHADMDFHDRYDFGACSQHPLHPDYPKPGIIFRDITTLLGNARAFAGRSTNWCSPMPA
jgi:hypothetical protein